MALLLTGGCGLGWEALPITTVEVGDDGRTLVVGYHCDADSSLEAEESAAEVRLSLRVYGGSRGDCADVEEVKLGSPLGDRRIVDASNEADILPAVRRR